ncbi:tape measure protein [Tistrella mobilis]|uniref:Phage tape measure protein n=1 Tax=Tistrella mobilis (strain KA081020-065) TaxID=1110502 RepID=I3TN71_TISMK|nr:tape measure protein [Tistrella mobilis]AFK54209.1 phage tape measure protein [Tistrella mobilis KA081020-065]
MADLRTKLTVDLDTGRASIAAGELRQDIVELGQASAATGQQIGRQGAQTEAATQAVRAAAAAAKAAARSQLDLAAAEQQSATAAARSAAARGGADRATDARQQRALAAAVAGTTAALADQAAQMAASAQSAALAAAGYADLTAQMRAAAGAARAVNRSGGSAAGSTGGEAGGGQSMSRQQRTMTAALGGASAALDTNAAAFARAMAAADAAALSYIDVSDAIYSVTRAARALAAETQGAIATAAAEARAHQTTTAVIVQGAQARMAAAGAAARAAAALETNTAALDRAAAAERDATAALRQAAQGRVTAAATAARAAAANDNVSRSSAGASRALADQARQAQGLGAVSGATTAVLAGLRGQLLGLASVAGLTVAARQVVAYADTWTNVAGRLSLVTQGSAALAAAQGDLFRIAQSTRATFEGTASLYSTLARQAQTLGASYTEMLLATTAIGQAFQVSGAGAASYEAALVQLGQGLASGTLRGEELNSVLEQAPRLALAIADGIGVGVGELRGLAEQGKLTSKAVFDAIVQQAPAVAAEFAKLRPTIGGAFQVLSNAALKWIGEADQASGASAGFAGTIMSLADNIDTAAAVAGGAGGVIAATLIGRGLGPMAAAAGTAAARMIELRQAVADGTAVDLKSTSALAERARYAREVADAAGEALTGAQARLVQAQDALAAGRTGAMDRLRDATTDVAAATTAHAAATARAEAAQVALSAAMGTTALRARAAAAGMALVNAAGGPAGIAITLLTVGVGYLATRTTEADRATEAWTDRIAAADKAMRSLNEAGSKRAGQLQVERDNIRASAEAEVALAEARLAAAQARLSAGTRADMGSGGVGAGLADLLGFSRAAEQAEAVKVARRELTLLRATIGDYTGEVGGAARWTGTMRREIKSLADVTATALKPMAELVTKTRDLQAQRASYGSGGADALRQTQAAQEARDLLAEAAKDQTPGARAQLDYLIQQARELGVAGKDAQEVLTNLGLAARTAEQGLASDQRLRQLQAEIQGAQEVAAAARISAAAEREADLRARARVEALGQVGRSEEEIYKSLKDQADATRDAEEARRGRQTAQELELAQREAGLAGATARARERALALARVDIDLRERGVDLTSAAAAAERARAVAALDAQAAIEDAGALRAAQDRVKALDVEIATIGRGSAAREQAMAVYEAEQSLRERGIALTSRQAAAEIDLARQAAQRSAVLKAGDDAAEMLEQAEAAERMAEAVSAGADAVRRATRDDYARRLALQLGTDALVAGTEANKLYLLSLAAFDRLQLGEVGQATATAVRTQRDALRVAQYELSLVSEAAARREYLVALEAKRVDLIRQYGNQLPKAATQELELYDQTLRTNALIEARTSQSQAFTAAIARAGEDIQDVLANTFEQVFDGGMDGFEDFGDQIVSVMKRSAAQIAALLVFRPLVSGVATSVLGPNMASQLGLATSTGGIPLPTGISSTAAAGAQTSGGGLFGGIGNIFGGGGGGLFSGVSSAIDSFGYSLGFGTPAAMSGSALSGLAAAESAGFTGAAQLPASGGWTSIPLSGVIGGALQGVGIGGFLSSLTGGNSTGGMIGGGLGGAAGTVIGGPIGGLIGSALGGLVGGLFGNKEPSNFAAWASYDVGSQDVIKAGYTRDSRNVGARDQLLDSIGKVSQALTEVTGASLDGVKRFLDVGGRDGIQWGASHASKVRLGDLSESGAKTALGKIAEDLAGELVGDIAPEIQTAIGKIDWSDLEAAFSDLQFAANYKDSLDWLTRGWDLADNAAKSARDSAQAQIDALADFRETASRLGQDTDAAAEATKAYVEQLLGIREAAPAVTDFQAAMIAAEASFQVYAKSAADFGLTAAQVAAALEARKDQIANDYKAALDRQLREAQGLGVVDQVADLVKEAEAAARDAMTAAGQAGVDQVGELLALRVRNLVQGSDLTSQAIDDLASRFPELSDLIRATAAAASESGKAIRSYLDDLATSAAGAGNPASRFQAAQDQFTRDLSAARAGDRDALGRITDAAQTLLDAGADMYGSGVQQAALVEWVRSSLSALPATQAYDDTVADNTGAVSALTAAIEALTVQLTASVASATAAVAVVPGYAAGGVVGNGIYNKDSVLAAYSGGGAIALAGGEHVTRATSVTPATLPVLDAINATGRVPAMGDGGATAAEVRALRDEVRALRQELAALRQTTAAAGGATVDAIERQTGEVRLGRRATERATAVAKMGRGA